MDDFIIFCNYIFVILEDVYNIISSNFLLLFSLGVFLVSVVMPKVISALTGDDDNNGGVKY